MSIKLDYLIMENFKSYLGSHKISFEEKQGNLVFIRGIDELDKSSNGSGKSTIVDAIAFAFFGRSLIKELNLDDLVCKRSANPMKIEMSFKDSSDGIVKATYRIERIRSKSPAHSKCFLFENNVCVSESMTNTEIQARLEQIIGMDYQIFVNNNVLNPELFKFVKGNSAQKVDILERVLNLNIVSKIFNMLSSVAKEDQTVFDDNDTEYYALKTSYDNLKQQEENLSKNVNENIQILNEKNNELREEIRQLTTKRDEYSTLVEGLSYTVEEKQQKINKLTEDKIKFENNISNHQKNIAYYAKNDKCHACKQPLPNRDAILAQEKQLVEQYTASVNDALNQITTLKTAPEFEQYNKLVNNADECTRKIREKTFNIAQNNKTIEKFNAITAESGKIDDVKAQLDVVEVEWKSSKENLAITEFWREMLVPKSKTRMSLASDLLKILNTNIQKYINNFYSKDFHLHFVVNDSNIVEVISINGERFKYDQLSSGERQKVDIVIVLSLLDIAMTYFKNNKLKFLIIDEATDHLDNVWARYVIEFIKQYAITLNMMILFISHHSVVDELDNLFDNTILAVKGIDGNSYIAKSRIR